MTEQKTAFERALEEVTGLSIQQLRDMSPEEMRALREKEFGKPLRIVGKQPFAFA